MSVDSLDTTSNRSLSLLALLTVTTAAAATVMVLWRYKRSLVLRFGNQVRNGAANAKTNVVNAKKRTVGMLSGAWNRTIDALPVSRAALEKAQKERDHALAVLRVHGEWSERNDLALAQAAEKIKILEEKLQSRVTKETEIQTDPQPSKTRIIKKPAPITASAGTQTDAHDEFDCVSTGSDEPLHRVKSDNGSNAGSAPQKQASQGFWSAIFGFSQKPAEPTTDASLKT